MTAVKDFATLALPPDLAEWQQENKKVIEHIHAALAEAQAPMSEEQLWNLLARTYSPTWAEARATLTDAEQKITIHKSHENRALGAIGLALESDSINKELAHYDEALALFTILDEELHQDTRLQLVIRSLVEDQRMLEESIRISRGLADITAAFGEVAQPRNTNSKDTPLHKAFGKIAQRLLKPRSRTSPSAQAHTR